MSERILDFEKAEESADHTDDAAWHISYNRALEAQAQAAVEKETELSYGELYLHYRQFLARAEAAEAELRRMQVASQKEWKATQAKLNQALHEGTEWQQRAEAAEAKLARVCEYVQECERESLPPLTHHLTEMLND